MDDLKRASARGVAWNLVQNLVSRLLALAVVSVQSRLIEREAFGSVAIALAITTFAELLVSQGYSEFVTQTKNLEDDHLDTAFWFNLSVGAILAGAIALSAHPLANLLDADASAVPVVRMMSLTLVLRSCAIVPYGLLARRMEFRALSMRSLISSIIAGAVAVIAAFSGAGVWSLVIQVLLGDLIAMIMLWVVIDWRPGRKISRRALRELSAFGTPIFAASLVALVSRRFDTLIVGGVLGLTSLGVYSLAQRAYQIALQVLNKSSADVVFSALSRLSDAEDRRRQAVLSVVELTSVLCFPFYFGLAVLAEPVTHLLFGARWLDAAPVLRVFALSGLPFTLSLVHVAVLKATARTRLLLIINVIQLAIYLPVTLVLVRHGIVAAALASLISCVAIVPFEIYILRTTVGVGPRAYFRSLRAAVVSTSAMALAAVPVSLALQDRNMVLQIAAVAGAGSLVYVGAVRITAPHVLARLRSLIFRRNEPQGS